MDSDASNASDDFNIEPLLGLEVILEELLQEDGYALGQPTLTITRVYCTNATYIGALSNNSLRHHHNRMALLKDLTHLMP